MGSYNTIKILETTKEELDRFKRANNLPSYSQAVTILVERQSVREQAIEEIGKVVAQETSKVMAKTLYEMLLQVAKGSNKPITSITLADIFDAIRSVEP